VLTGHAAEVHGCIGSAENQYDYVSIGIGHH